MDRQFMEDFYKKRYEDPVSEICEDDNEFYKVRYKAYRDIEEMEERLEGLRKEAEARGDNVNEWIEQISKELILQFNKTLDDLGEKYSYIIQKAYLQGALDREKMLR